MYKIFLQIFFSDVFFTKIALFFLQLYRNVIFNVNVRQLIKSSQFGTRYYTHTNFTESYFHSVTFQIQRHQWKMQKNLSNKIIIWYLIITGKDASKLALKIQKFKIRNAEFAN